MFKKLTNYWQLKNLYFYICFIWNIKTNQVDIFWFSERFGSNHSSRACFELLSSELEVDLCSLPYCYGSEDKYFKIQPIPGRSSYSLGQRCRIIPYNSSTNCSAAQRQGNKKDLIINFVS